MPRIKLGPLCLDTDPAQAVLGTIRKIIRSRTPSRIVTLNSLMFNAALANAELAAAIRSADLVVPDSYGVTWAADFLGGAKGVRRITGIDLVYDICEIAAREGYGLFLLGARPGVAAEAAVRLSALYPGLKVIGQHDGYFTDPESGAVADNIAKTRPQILLVAMDMPRQELWIARNSARLGVPVVMGVGGSFDVISGRLGRAPGWMQSLRLEWLFRLLQQPWRIGRILDLPLFVLHIVSLKFRRNGRSRNQ